MTENYKDLRFTTYSDAIFSLAQVEKTMCIIRLDKPCGRKDAESRVAGRGKGTKARPQHP